jgi:hypothetical protein
MHHLLRRRPTYDSLWNRVKGINKSCETFSPEFGACRLNEAEETARVGPVRVERKSVKDEPQYVLERRRAQPLSATKHPYIAVSK